MSLAWADDKPRRQTVKVRCCEDLSDNGDCQWHGSVWVVLSYGIYDLRPEQCPGCGGRMEVDE